MKRILHSTAAKVLKMKISAKQSKVILPILCVFVGFIPLACLVGAVSHRTLRGDAT